MEDKDRLVIQVVGQVMVYDASGRQWHPAGTSSGLSTVKLIHNLPKNTFRIHGQRINELKEVVLDSEITREVKYNRANEAFIQWHDSQAYWGLNFRRGSPDAESFFGAIVQVLRVLNQSSNQQQPNLSDTITNQQQLQQQQLQQQQSQPTNSAAIIQRSLLQQQSLQQQQASQPMLLQQQPQIMTQQQPQQQILSQGPAVQLMQQQPNQQQQLLQQQQMHQHYMQHQQQQTQAPAPQQPNHNHINHYQPQQQPPPPPPPPPPQPQQQPTQQLQQQIPPVVAAQIPPPPPPPPPAPPAMNISRLNGTGNNTAVTNANVVSAAPSNNNGNSLQHSPIATNNFGINGNIGRNGCSPNQAVSLANELAKCQLRKVNLSRSDSEKEPECNNNNNISNAKTTRAASLAYVPGNLMNDLSRKLASRKSHLEQQEDSQSVSTNNVSGNNVTNTNGVGGDKDTWLADLIRKEISKEITKMKAEIIDAIKTELRQR